MVIDFRVRPPYRGFLEMGIFTKYVVPQKDPRKLSAFEMGRAGVPSCEQRSMELFMQEMDEAGVEACVVMGRKNKGHAINAGNILPEDLYELADSHPGRFLPFAGIDPNDAGACQEVEYVAKELGFKGISMDPGWCEPCMHADDERILAVCETASQLGIIVTLTASGVAGPDLSYADPLTIQRVAKKFPNLKIVVAHACWPFVPQILGVAMTCPNIYLVPDVYLYTDNMPMSDLYVTAANGYLKYRTLFASTYPVGGLRQSIEKWSAKGFTEESLKLTLHDNAAELLGL